MSIELSIILRFAIAHVPLLIDFRVRSCCAADPGNKLGQWVTARAVTTQTVTITHDFARECDISLRHPSATSQCNISEEAFDYQTLLQTDLTDNKTTRHRYLHHRRLLKWPVNGAWQSRRSSFPPFRLPRNIKRAVTVRLPDEAIHSSSQVVGAQANEFRNSPGTVQQQSSNRAMLPGRHVLHLHETPMFSTSEHERAG